MPHYLYLVSVTGIVSLSLLTWRPCILPTSDFRIQTAGMANESKDCQTVVEGNMAKWWQPGAQMKPGRAQSEEGIIKRQCDLGSTPRASFGWLPANRREREMRDGCEDWQIAAVGAVQRGGKGLGGVSTVVSSPAECV
ncbi:hypothetical protein F5Y03DRAFT_390012 [Xylaria venustula]|nr:hypothetical protein F5Y03DRAFT_390012 [Xylaria venustula]